MVVSDNVLTFKIMSKGVQCSERKSLFHENNPTYSLSNNQPFYHNVAITRNAENIPIYRQCVCYNDLSLRICIKWIWPSILIVYLRQWFQKWSTWTPGVHDDQHGVHATEKKNSGSLGGEWGSTLVNLN